MKKPTLLIVTYISAHRMRNVQKNLVDCYKAHLPNYAVTYVNLFMSNALQLCAKRDWDFIIFHSSLLSLRFNRERYIALLERNEKSLSDLKARKKAMTIQDEFAHMDLACKFITDNDISVVFSVASEDQFQKLYPQIDFSHVEFHRVLTGYVDYTTVAMIEKNNLCLEGRPYLIGYRVVSSPHWGSFNLKKKEIADIVIAECEARDEKHDIKIGEQHFLHGDDWVLQLAKCRATIGIEGGANILDWDGSFSERIKGMMNDSIDIDHDMLRELELDLPQIQLKAISPRHLEACMTRTCQILLEGDYNGILKPWEHYLPLNSDYSNLPELLNQLNDDEIVKNITDKAFDDIISKGNFGYDKFTEFVIHSLENTLDNAHDEVKLTKTGIFNNLLFKIRLGVSNTSSWLIAYAYFIFKNLGRN